MDYAPLVNDALKYAYEGKRDLQTSQVLWDAVVEHTGPLRTVHGTQAKGARLLGLTKVTEDSARRVWDAGFPVIMVGSNVNSFHFFGGWRLAYVPSEDALKEPFDRIANSFGAYREPELGQRTSFFILGIPPKKTR